MAVSCELINLLMQDTIFQRFTLILAVEKMQPALEFYKSDLIDANSFPDEFLLWQARWRRIDETDRPKTAATTVHQCDLIWFPNIRRLIEVGNSFFIIFNNKECIS